MGGGGGGDGRETAYQNTDETLKPLLVVHIANNVLTPRLSCSKGARG